MTSGSSRDSTGSSLEWPPEGHLNVSLHVLEVCKYITTWYLEGCEVAMWQDVIGDVSVYLLLHKY